MFFENSLRAKEIIEKYRFRYVPIITQFEVFIDKKFFILPENDLNAEKFLLSILQLQRNERERNPLTRLPGNEAIKDQLEKNILSQDGNWLGYVDINNFKAYNDRYGFGLGDRLIVNLAEILKECIGENFIGHIGGDDFVFICKRDNLVTLDLICRRFDQSLVSHYPEVDLKREEIIGIDRAGEEKKFGLAHLSIAVLTKKYHNFPELNYAAAIIKNIAKEQSKTKKCSLWLWDKGVNITHRDNLLKILAGQDNMAKRAAIEVLGEIAEEKNLDLFINLLKSEDFLIRKSAVYALGRVAKQEVVEPLLKALNDSSPHVRMRAAEALGSFYDLRIPNALLKTLGDQNLYVKEAAIKSIARLKIKDTLPILFEITDKRLIPSVLNALGEIGDARALPFIEKTLNEREFLKSAVRALSKITETNALEILLKLLVKKTHLGQDFIYRAIYNFSKIPKMEPFLEAKKELIIAGLDSVNPYYPIMILHQIKDQQANKTVKNFVRDKRVYLRQAAILYLSNWPENLPIIAQVLIKDPSPLVRKTAASGLAKLGKEGLPFLRKALKDDNLEVRRSSARAILQILF